MRGLAGTAIGREGEWIVQTEKSQECVDRAFVAEVRKAAGFRVSPRQISPILEALRQRGCPINPAAVAELVKVGEAGDASARQRRNAYFWRLLGAYLALDGKPAHREAQRAFIGRVRRLVQQHYPDRVLLEIAVAIGAAGFPLEASTVASAVRWLQEQLGSDLQARDLAPFLDEAAKAAALSEQEKEKRPGGMGRSAPSYSD